jgi:serine/threonine protein kinase
MSSERWARINELFYAALDYPAEQRNAFLKESCGSDPSLQEEVESLLSAYFDSKDFIQLPASKTALDLLQHREVQLSEGESIGAYKIVREIGRGGMGAVYLGVRADDRFQKSVAIKVLKRGMDTDDVLRHFRIEQQILGNLDHPNIARLIDAGSTENGLPYFIMEYVEGEPIDQYCDRLSLSITERLQLFQQVCAAISYAHRNLVVHRDIKPSNILVSSDGVPKLLDFGIAKILMSESGEKSTATGIHFMTPEYASPEQAKGLQVTTLSDVYSLGVLLYELLTGHFPYTLKNRSAVEILRTITETQPQLPSTIIDDTKQRRRLRGDLDNIVLMALRKEPQRRYQSVDQFSEDIHRHLQGLPISAHKDTIAYRASRFILRNRIAVTIVVLSILTLALFATIMQWRANKQAKLFQEFGQEVTRIESFMRYAYLLPLHNIEQDKKRVTDRLDYIKKRMEVMGTISYGPGYYSLGRGYLSLHRYQDAYDNLILAWQKYGYQEPAAANALGLSLTMLYQEKLREARQLYNKEQLPRRMAELEKQYRSPAQAYIQKGANASESPEYVQSLLEFLEKKYPQALDKAQAAEHNISWHYESKKLQGDIFNAMANDQSSIGKTAEASELYGKAKVAYLHAAKKGQSDSQIYDALCSVHSSLLMMEIEQKGKSPEEVVIEGISFCKKALQADSKDINANLLASRIYRDWAYHENERGIDSTGTLEKSANFARSALKIDSENGLAHLTLGMVYNTRADQELVRERDPIPFLDIANISLTKAIKKLPEDHQLLSVLANNYFKRGRHFISTGKDPLPALNKAIDLLKKAIQLSPENSRYLSMLGAALNTKGGYENDIGLDGRATLQESIQFSKRSFAINPKYLAPYIWCGLSYLALANDKMDKGEDPSEELEEAIKVYGKALETDAEQSYAHAGIGIAFWKKGDTLQKAGKDPTSALQASREAFKKAIEIDSKTVITYALYAEVDLVAARYAITKQQPPEPFFKESERIVRECLSVNPDSGECLESLTANYLLRAEYLLSSGRSAKREILLGIKNADHTLKVNATNALVMAYRAKLFLIRAQSSSGISRKQHALEAKQSFDQAFKIKNILRREYGKHWEEAQRLSQTS